MENYWFVINPVCRLFLQLNFLFSFSTLVLKCHLVQSAYSLGTFWNQVSNTEVELSICNCCINKTRKGYMTSQGHPQSFTPNTRLLQDWGYSLDWKKWFSFGSEMRAILLGSLFLYDIMGAINTLRSYRKWDYLLHIGLCQKLPSCWRFYLSHLLRWYIFHLLVYFCISACGRHLSKVSTVGEGAVCFQQHA